MYDNLLANVPTDLWIGGRLIGLKGLRVPAVSDGRARGGSRYHERATGTYSCQQRGRNRAGAAGDQAERGQGNVGDDGCALLQAKAVQPRHDRRFRQRLQRALVHRYHQRDIAKA